MSKKIDPNDPRCESCNELLTKADLRDLKKNGGICCYCHSFNDTYRYPQYSHYECDMSVWLNQLRLDDLPIRNPSARITGSDLREEELK